MVAKKLSHQQCAKRALKYFPIFLFLVFVSFVMLTPFLWMIFSSFKSDMEIIAYPPKFFPTGNHFVETWEAIGRQIDLFRYIFNTVIYAVGRTVPSLLINAIAGYVFARFKFRGKNMLFLLFLATMMIPFQVIMVPLYIEVYWLNWLNTFAGLIIPGVASGYTIFLFRSSFAGLPSALEDAARIDGCSEFKIFWKIMLPLVKPTIITTVLLSVNGCWNDLLWPLIVASKSEMRTLSNGIAVFIGEHTNDYASAFVCSLISMLPMLVLYLFGQKYFIKGTASSGIKG